MPQLPTFTVTDAQATRLLAAFGSAAAYKEWLKEALIAHVLEVEDLNARVQLQRDREAQAQKLKNEISTSQ